MKNTIFVLLFILGILMVLYFGGRTIFIRRVKETIRKINLKFDINLTNQKEMMIRIKKYLEDVYLKKADDIFASIRELSVKFTTIEKVNQFNISSIMIKEISKITEENNLFEDLKYMSLKNTLDELSKDFSSLIILYNNEIKLFNRQLNMLDGKLIAKVLRYKKEDLFK